MSKAQVEATLGKRVLAVHPADGIDESGESPALLAREAARGIFEEFDEEPTEVMEMADGFAVTSPGRVIFMGHDGSFDIADLADKMDPKTAESDSKPGKFVLVQTVTGEIVSPAQDLTTEEASERTASFEAQGSPLRYVPETDTEGGRLKSAFTLDDLQTQVEVLLSDADPSDEKLMPLLSAFDAAKQSEDYSSAIGAAKAIAEMLGKTFTAPSPKPPLDTGPGPGKSTSGGGGALKVGVPTTPAPEPKKPLDTGPGPGKSVGEARGKGMGVGGQRQGDGGTDTCRCPECGTTAPHARGTPCAESKCPKCGTAMVGEAVEITFPAARIQEFIETAQKAGAGDDVKVVKEGDSYTVTLEESVARAVAPFFKGDDVVQESVST